MAKAAEQLTVADLEKILETRRSILQNMLEQRGKIQRELDRIDSAIRQLQGNERISVSGRGKGPRRQNSVSLRQLVQELLAKSKKGYTLAELTEHVFASGYKSDSTNFRNVLYQCLYNLKDAFHDAETGTYRLKSLEKPAEVAPVMVEAPAAKPVAKAPVKAAAKRGRKAKA